MVLHFDYRQPEASVIIMCVMLSSLLLLSVSNVLADSADDKNTSILPNIFSLRVEPEQRRGSVVSHVSLIHDLQQLFQVNV